MSADHSRAIGQAYGANIISVPEGSFDHGLTRNAGAEAAKGEFLYLTVQDAWIADNTMLEKMLHWFSDPGIAAVGGCQAVPHEADKNPLRWFRRFSKPVPEVREIAGIDRYRLLNQASQQAIIAWDNVVAMYRKEVLHSIPFVATEMSEDWVWSRDAILKGWKLIYDPSLLVYHYHHETYRYVYRVVFSVSYHQYKFFGFKPSLPPVFTLMARATWHLLKNPQLCFGKKIYWIFHNYGSVLARLHATLVFLFYLRVGGMSALDKKYKLICKSIPQGKQK